MNEELRQRALAHGGVITTKVPSTMGIGRSVLAEHVRSGALRRVHAGCFVLGEALVGAPPGEVYRLRTAAVLLGRAQAPSSAPTPCRDRASHHAGLAVHGLPVHGCDLGVVDVSAPVVHSSRTSLVRVHPLVDGDVMARVKGVPAASVATCLVQTAAASGVTAGVVALDAALHERLVSVDEVLARADAMDLRYGDSRVRLMLEQADPACESPGESLTRLLLRSLGMVFVSQAEIRAPGFLARVDFLVGRVVVEFDGAVKYAGAEGRHALVREKRREDELRRLGYEVVRLTWADLRDPARVGRLIREAQARVSSR
jgi:very-short-patch-repair endonuclease